MIHNLLFLSKTVILGHRCIPQVLEKPDSSEDAWINNQKHDDLTHEQCIGKSSQNVYLMIIYIDVIIYPIESHYIPLHTIIILLAIETPCVWSFVCVPWPG